MLQNHKEEKIVNLNLAERECMSNEFLDLYYITFRGALQSIRSQLVPLLSFNGKSSSTIQANMVI